MSSAEIKITGGDKYKAVLAKIAAQNVGVRAGVLKGATNDETGESVAPYAAAMEFGSHINRGGTDIVIPSRPFMRQAVENHKDEWINWLADAMQNNSNGARAALNILGARIRGDISDEIGHGHFERLSKTTVQEKAYKGRANPEHPLIDTGSLRASLSYEVVES